MNLVNKLFAGFAVTCGAAWLTKQAAIATIDGSPVVGGLWAVGMLSFVLACALGVVALLRPAPAWARVVAGVVAVPVSFVALNLLDTLVKSVYQSDGLFRDEVALVIAAVVLGALGLRTFAGSRPAREGVASRV